MQWKKMISDGNQLEETEEEVQYIPKKKNKSAKKNKNSLFQFGKGKNKIEEDDDLDFGEEFEEDKKRMEVKTRRNKKEKNDFDDFADFNDLDIKENFILDLEDEPEEKPKNRKKDFDDDPFAELLASVQAEEEKEKNSKNSNQNDEVFKYNDYDKAEDEIKIKKPAYEEKDVEEDFMENFDFKLGEEKDKIDENYFEKNKKGTYIEEKKKEVSFDLNIFGDEDEEGEFPIDLKLFEDKKEEKKEERFIEEEVMEAYKKQKDNDKVEMKRKDKSMFDLDIGLEEDEELLEKIDEMYKKSIKDK
jgi:hypothetical protein